MVIKPVQKSIGGLYVYSFSIKIDLQFLDYIGYI